MDSIYVVLSVFNFRLALGLQGMLIVVTLQPITLT